jgi:hypothetical protein
MTTRVFEAVGGKEVARVLLGNTVRMVAFSPNGDTWRQGRWVGTAA